MVVVMMMMMMMMIFTSSTSSKVLRIMQAKIGLQITLEKKVIDRKMSAP